MREGKEWLEERFKNESQKNGNNNNDEDDDNSDLDSINSVDSNDTLHNFIEFQSHRNSIGLEEAISFAYPFEKSLCKEMIDYESNCNDKNSIIKDFSGSQKRITISTLLEEADLVPIFDGAGWAGTRVWSAAIYGIKYLVEEFGHQLLLANDKKKGLSLCELGCGLGVPGMIWHQLGGDVVLSDQNRIMSQLRGNVKTNFKESYGINSDDADSSQLDVKGKASIYTHPLDWSREGYQDLLRATGFQNGFDILLNCDCVYEPLYGKSWEYLVEVIDECLRLNPKCCVVTSVERRTADGIDEFIQAMERSDHVSKVEKVCEDKAKKLELYITKGN